MQYVVCYELFGCPNSFGCQVFSQYCAFICVMEEEFGEQFEVKEIHFIRN